jgi:hypothetical protein
MIRSRKTKKTSYKELDRKFSSSDYLILSGLLLLASAFFLTYHDWERYVQWNFTEGIILKSVPVKTLNPILKLLGQEYAYYPVVEFTPEDDVRHPNKIVFISTQFLFNSRSLLKNEKVTVYYENENPYYAEIDLMGARDLEMIFVIGLCFLGIYLVWRGVKKLKLKKEFKLSA